MKPRRYKVQQSVNRMYIDIRENKILYDIRMAGTYHMFLFTKKCGCILYLVLRIMNTEQATRQKVMSLALVTTPKSVFLCFVGNFQALVCFCINSTSDSDSGSLGSLYRELVYIKMETLAT